MGLVFSFLCIGSLLIPCAYVSIESIDCILLSSFELKLILLISSVKALYLLLLNLCCVCFLQIFFVLFYLLYINLHQLLSFLNSLFYFQFEILLSIFHNFKIKGFFTTDLFVLFAFLSASLLSFK